MPTYTEHLKLVKPAPHDFYDVGVPNGNMDALDRYVAGLREELGKKVDITAEITHGANLNDWDTPGFYCCCSDAAAASLSNCPTHLAFSLLVERGAGGQVVQTLKVREPAISVYIRSQYPSWQPWVRLATEGDLANKVDIGRPEKYDLQLADDVEKNVSCYCYKNSFGEVNVVAAVKKESGFKVFTEVATLPEGFVPAEVVEVPATFLETDTSATRHSGTVVIQPSGLLQTVITRTSATFAYAYFQCAFLAAQ